MARQTLIRQKGRLTEATFVRLVSFENFPCECGLNHDNVCAYKNDDTQQVKKFSSTRQTNRDFLCICRVKKC